MPKLKQAIEDLNSLKTKISNELELAQKESIEKNYTAGRLRIKKLKRYSEAEIIKTQEGYHQSQKKYPPAETIRLLRLYITAREEIDRLMARFDPLINDYDAEEKQAAHITALSHPPAVIPIEAPQVIVPTTPTDQHGDEGYRYQLGRLIDLKKNDDLLPQLEQKLDRLIYQVKQLKQEGKESIETLITALDNTHQRLTGGGMTDQAYTDYARKMQGKASVGMNVLGGLMLALSLTALILGLVFFPMVVSFAGTAAAALSLSLTPTAATITAGIAVGGSSALLAAGAIGLFSSGKTRGLSLAMRTLNNAQKEQEHEALEKV